MASQPLPSHTRLVELTRTAVLDSPLAFSSERWNGDRMIFWEAAIEASGTTFEVTAAVLNGRYLSVVVMREGTVPPDRLQPVSELCFGLNRDSPFTALLLSRQLNRVVAKYDFPDADEVDWRFIANLISLAVEGATAFEPLIADVIAGGDARAALDSFPGYTWPDPTPTDVWHIDMLERTASQLGWPKPKRISPVYAMVLCEAGLAHVDALYEQVWISSYVFDKNTPPGPPEHLPAVAELLGLISDEAMPCALALDFESGNVRTRRNLPLAGTRIGDPGSLIANAVSMTAGFANYWAPVIQRVATSNVAPAVAMSSHLRSGLKVAGL